MICWMVVRTKIPGRWLLDNVASLPMVFPGPRARAVDHDLLSQHRIGVYGTIWIMLIAYMTRFLPYGMRYASTSMLQIHKELEESAAMSGASWAMTFRRIVLPLLKPGLLAGWIYVMIVSIRELSSSILLYSPGTEVVSIMIWELWQNGQYVELSALGVLLIIVLFCLVMIAQCSARVGIAEDIGISEGCTLSLSPRPVPCSTLGGRGIRLSMRNQKSTSGTTCSRSRRSSPNMRANTAPS